MAAAAAAVLAQLALPPHDQDQRLLMPAQAEMAQAPQSVVLLLHTHAEAAQAPPGPAPLASADQAVAATAIELIIPVKALREQ
jgi:hypothetical protein